MVNNTENSQIDHLFIKYENGEISEDELTNEQIVLLEQMYDKKDKRKESQQ